MKKIWIINGPNLNLLGKREPHIYGDQSFEEYFEYLTDAFETTELHYFQSNHEGELIDKLHETGFSADGIVLNAGAYSHTSIAIADAVAAISAPVVTVHISNVYQREAFRRQDYPAAAAVGSIFGLGLEGYRLAVQYLTAL